MFAFISFKCYTEFDSPFKLLGKYIPLFEGELKGGGCFKLAKNLPQPPLAEGDKYSCPLNEGDK
jgi:hypothetical protein